MSKVVNVSTLVLLVLTLGMLGCSKSGQDEGLITTESGLRYIDVVEGEGIEAANGMQVKVHYTLWLDENGEKGRLIQSSKERNQPFPFTVGQQGLIQGWNEGMVGMKPGGTRRMYVPSRLGYGSRGMPPAIPANADLIFEIELLEIQ